MKKRLLIVAALAMAMAFALAACGPSGSLSDAIDDETGAVTVTAKNAGKDSAVASLGGGITIEENELFVISPNMQKGALQVKLMDAAGEVVLDEEASGTVLSTYTLAPGEYSFGVTCKTNGATGTTVLAAVNADDYAAQNAELEKILGTSAAVPK